MIQFFVKSVNFGRTQQLMMTLKCQLIMKRRLYADLAQSRTLSFITSVLIVGSQPDNLIEGAFQSYTAFLWSPCKMASSLFTRSLLGHCFFTSSNTLSQKSQIFTSLFNVSSLPPFLSFSFWVSPIFFYMSSIFIFGLFDDNILVAINRMLFFFGCIYFFIPILKLIFETDIISVCGFHF